MMGFDVPKVQYSPACMSRNVLTPALFHHQPVKQLSPMGIHVARGNEDIHGSLLLSAVCFGVDLQQITHSRQSFGGFEAGYGHGIGRTILVNGYGIDL